MPKKTILIIDDEEDLRKLLKMNLESAGDFKVITAANGMEGIAWAQKIKPDLILLDILMPDMDGIETLKILRKDKDTFKVPVIMLTALGYAPFKSRALELRADGYITKPIDAGELKTKIDNVLKGFKGGLENG
ncbi:MAG: response regulator [Candidatus Omnitrophota bacterium]|jgi:two-component system alkaline phosphatase synthesis response regulator PhoP